MFETDLEDLTNLGIYVRKIIFNGASYLRDDWMPGLICLGLIVLLAFVFLYLIIKDHQRIAALKWAVDVVSRTYNQQDFTDKFLEIDRIFIASTAPSGRWLSYFSKDEYRRPIGVAWKEFRDTMVIPEINSGDLVRNSIRPSVFFDIEELGFEQKWWRVWPGLFVSLGLLLTFLGLVAALIAIENEITDDSLRELLNAASAKFIMSLTGLACSIFLMLMGRSSTSSVENQIRLLCQELEKRLQFYSLEAIAHEQLNVIKETESTIRQVATDMVAQLSRPLKEDLPAAIGESFRVEIAPLLERLSKTSEQGLGQMVGDLSQTLSGEINESMTQVTGSLDIAAEKISGLLKQLESSSDRIGKEHEEIISNMGSQYKEFQEAFERAAKAAHDGGIAIEMGSKKFASASEVMANAADPIKTGVEGFQLMIEQDFKNSQKIAEQTQSALKSAELILTEKQKAITDSMEALKLLLTELKGQGENLDTIDQKFGKAFEEYRTQVEATIEGTNKQVSEIVESLTPALATLTNVVEQVEEFVPQSRPQSGDS